MLRFPAPTRGAHTVRVRPSAVPPQRLIHRARRAPLLLATLLTSVSPVLWAQGTTGQSGGAQAVTPADVRLLAEVHVTLSAVHDSADARAAQARNKTRDAQGELAQQKREAVTQVLSARGLTEERFQRLRYAVSTDASLRTTFDSVVAVLTGAPTPGRVEPAAAAPGAVPASALPSGLAGTHVGHVTTSYVDTPDKSGLLPMAFAEATIASQHATLAARTPDELASMQLHAGHVLHALDPSRMPSGPGKGYGLRKAAGGVAQHIELAAKEPSATPAITTHAPHIAAAARATLARMEQAITIAAQIRSATDPAAAAGLVAQLASLCSQLVSGADLNADGRVDFGNGEGGLRQAQEHVTLMLRR
jgi:hypothetical protein